MSMNNPIGLIFFITGLVFLFFRQSFASDKYEFLTSRPLVEIEIESIEAIEGSYSWTFHGKVVNKFGRAKDFEASELQGVGNLEGGSAGPLLLGPAPPLIGERMLIFVKEGNPYLEVESASNNFSPWMPARQELLKESYDHYLEWAEAYGEFYGRDSISGVDHLRRLADGSDGFLAQWAERMLVDLREFSPQSASRITERNKERGGAT